MKRKRAYLHSLCAGPQSGTRPITVDEVIYFRAGGTYTAVVTKKGEQRIGTPLTELLALLDPEKFWQVHRSTVVNVSRIEAVTPEGRDHVVLKLKERDESITVGHPFCRQFLEHS